MIQLKNVSKSFKKHQILQNVNLEFPKTGCIALIGANGSGKSVILNLICGFIKPDEGEIIINSKNITKDRAYIYDAGIIINSPEFVPYKSVEQNLYDIAAILNREDTHKKIENLLEYFDLAKDRSKKYNSCSLGMKQKMRIIQAFMEEHPVYILDEITSALDKNMVTKVYQYINELKKDNLVIITSHYENDINNLADKIYEVQNGEVI